MNKGGTQWEAWTTPTGDVCIQQADGGTIIIKKDGITGYSFALEYLRKLAINYKNHLKAANLILQQQLGNKYKYVKEIPNVYNAHLAIISISCCFAAMDHIPTCDAQGELHVKFVKCPLRAICRYNGYNPQLSNEKIVCCNPIYETNLSKRQTEMAELLLNTDYSMEDIAKIMEISYQRARCIASEVYTTLKVNSRTELTRLLKDKRIT